MGLAVLGLLLLWLATWLAVPPILKSQLQSHLGEQLGRLVTIGQVDFKPWSLELEVRDLAIAQASGLAAPLAQDTATPGADAQVQIKRLYINMALESVLRLAPVVDAVVVESPHVKLRHTGQGRYDVDDVLAKLASQPANPEASPLRFALYNLVLQDGELEFTDQPQGKVHHLNQLNISLPFLSNLDAHRDVLAQPQLAFALNGSRFDSSAQTTPFAANQKAEVQLALKRLDLAPYLGYWPASLPLRLTAAVLEADLKLVFEQTQKPLVTLSGLVALHAVKVQAAARAAASDTPELLAFERLGVQIKSLRPLERVALLERLELSQPRVTLRRDAQGILNWAALSTAPQTLQNNTKKIAASAGAAKASGQKSNKTQQPADASPWQLGINQIALTDGEVQWHDALTPQPAQLTLTTIELQAQALAWPFAQAMPFQGKAMLAKSALGFKGSATDRAANVSATVADLPLALAAPYLAQHLVPTLDGTLNTELGLRWQAAGPTDAAAQLVLTVPTLALDKLALTGPGKTRLASVKQVRLEAAEVDVARQTVMLARARITQPQTSVSRDAQGQWNFERWRNAAAAPGTLDQPAAGTTTATNAARATASASAPQPAASNAQDSTNTSTSTDKPWAVSVQDFALTEGALGFQDEANAQPVALDVSGVALQVNNFSSAAAQPFGLNLAALVRHGNTEPGRLSWRGKAALSPLGVQGELAVQRLPVHALAPYASQGLNLALLRADASFKGQLQLSQPEAGLTLRLRGDTRLEDVLVNTRAPAPASTASEELLSWKSLALDGVDLALKPGTVPQVSVQSTVLSDFFARLILSETGRLSLQDAIQPGPPARQSGGEPSSPPDKPASAQAPTASASNDTKTVAGSEVSTGSGAEKDAQKPALANIQMGPLTLTGGRVLFTDRFIKPNYSADLTELAGKLGAFSNQPVDGQVQLAELELRGRAEGTATLEVLGKVNPLAKPLALDIKGRVRDLELPPLSPYSVRYAGYGIERGKLSVDIAYLVQPDGQLTASNNIVLNQLKFGDKVPGATASLPVKLAVALLADRNGVIDLNLPVSGSLNDPQFRLMPLVFKIIGNLIVKAITAPFSLLASALGGGGDDMSVVNFDAGTATLSGPARAGLDKVAKALQERPALKMTVIGTASLEQEREAFKRAQLRSLLLAEKRRDNPGPAAAASEPVQVSDQDYPALLKAVYKRADFAKPRNLIGLAKDIPVPEMEALLLANLSATEADLAALAVKRGVVVRDYLAGLKLPMDRLFLGAVKAVPPDAKWQPRAELNLTLD